MKQDLLEELRKVGDWRTKWEICRMEVCEGYSEETVARYLRILAQDEELEVGYYHGRRGQRLAKYRIKHEQLRLKM